jgi:hypothetical protein
VNIFELATTLPNGLHDAEIVDFSVSYAERALRFRCDIWVGNMDAAPEVRETYRLALIECKDVEYCILDRPDPAYPYATSTRLTIDLVEPDPGIQLPGEGKAFRFWVSEWNGFFHVRAGVATLTWEAGARIRSNGV